MADSTSNDNDFAAAMPIGAEPHGQAALLLVESLLHNLVAREIIGIGDAVELVGVAIEVAGELDGSPDWPRSSRTILETLHTSLSRDLP